MAKQYLSTMFSGKQQSERRWSSEWAIRWRWQLRSSRFLQVLLIIAFWQAGEVVVKFAHLPMPGAVAGLFLLLAALANRKLRPQTFRLGARWLLAELLLFLLPTVVSLVGHPEFMGVIGLKLFVAILLGTLIVMLVTALVVEFCYRWMAAFKT